MQDKQPSEMVGDNGNLLGNSLEKGAAPSRFKGRPSDTSYARLLLYAVGSVVRPV